MPVIGMCWKVGVAIPAPMFAVISALTITWLDGISGVLFFCLVSVAVSYDACKTFNCKSANHLKNIIQVAYLEVE